MWDIEKLIEILKEKKLLNWIVGKRPGVPRLPAQLFLRLVVASVATNKDISACIYTAIETYTIRNENKHFDEIKLKAAAANKTIEEFIADEVVKRIGKISSKENERD